MVDQITKDTSQIVEVLQHTVWVLQEQIREFNKSGQVCISDIEQLVYDLRGELYGACQKAQCFTGRNYKVSK